MIKKKILCLILVLGIILLMPNSQEKQYAQANEKPIQVIINGEELLTDVAPIIISGRTLVPLRAIFEALGAEVEWDEKNRQVIGRKVSLSIILQIDNQFAKLNNQQIELDVAAIIINDRTMVPIRFIAESLGEDVFWDSENRMVKIGDATAEVKNANETIIARVNADEINQEEFNKRYQLLIKDFEKANLLEFNERNDQELVKILKERAFEELVMTKLLEHEARAREIEIDVEQIKNELNQIKASKNILSNNGYREFLKEYNIDEDFLINELKIQQIYLAIQKQITQAINIDDSEKLAYYQSNFNKYNQSDGILIAHILVESEKQAHDLLAKIKNGEDFAGLAQEYSLCPSKSDGGNLGMVNQATPFVEEIKVAALDMGSGEISQKPVKTDFGYHILKAGAIIEGESRSFEEVKEEINLILLKVKSEEQLYQYLVNLRREAVITILNSY